MSAVLLTGATGFVGRNIARALLARGETVVAFAPEPPRAPLEGTVMVAGDVRSAGDLDRAFAAGPVDRVIHAAALTPDAAMEAEQPGLIVDVNVGGTVQVMQAARRAGVSRLIAMSSAAVYGHGGDGGGVIGEDDGAQPAALYGVTKLAAEQAALRLGVVYGIEVAAVRLGPCFGIGEHPTGVRPMLSPHWQCAEAARKGEECVLPREMTADWIDALDAATTIAALLATRSLPPVPINLGGGRVTSAAEWCAVLGRLRPGFRWRIDAEAYTVRYGLGRDRPAMDTSRLRALLGMAPDTDALEHRARRYLAWRDGKEGVALCGA